MVNGTAMTIQIALIRGINVGGHQAVAMSDLRDLLTQLGFERARSLLQSGNLVFRGDARTSDQLEPLLQEAHNINPANRVLLRVDEVAQVKRLTFIEDACTKAGFAGASLTSPSQPQTGALEASLAPQRAA